MKSKPNTDGLKPSSGDDVTMWMCPMCEALLKRVEVLEACVFGRVVVSKGEITVHQWDRKPLEEEGGR